MTVATPPPAARIGTLYCLSRTTAVTPGIHPHPYEDPQAIEHTPLSLLTLSSETPDAVTLCALMALPSFPASHHPGHLENPTLVKASSAYSSPAPKQ